MIRALLLMLAVAGCSADPPIARPVAVALPADTCPPAPPAVPIPPLPRTFDTVVAFGRETDARRQQTVRALEQCRKSLEGR